MASERSEAAARGSAASKMAPMAATPVAPARMTAAAFSGVMPPMPMTGARTCAQIVGEGVEAEGGAAGVGGGREDGAEHEEVGAFALRCHRLVEAVDGR